MSTPVRNATRIDEPKRTAWLPWLPTEDERLRVFCFPHAGGAASAYRSWMQGELGHRATWLPVELPGRGTRRHELAIDEPNTLIEQLIDALLPEMHPPFAFLGHSMGALIAAHLAHELQSRGKPVPVCVVVSGVCPPGHGEVKRFHDLPRAALVKVLRELNGTPTEVLENDEMFDLMLPLLRADLALVHRLRHLPLSPLRSPMVAVSGTEDASAPLGAMAHWQDFTQADFAHLQLPGDHFFLYQQARAVQSHLLSRFTLPE